MITVNKRIFVVTAMLSTVAAVSARASTFESNLARLKDREAHIDRTLSNMAAQTGYRSNAPLLTDDQETNSKTRPLMTIHADLTRTRLNEGHVLSASIKNRLVVGSEPSPVILSIASNQGLASGLKIIGNARQSSTQGRVNLELSRLIFLNGVGKNIKAIALDTTGAAGLEAQVFSSKALMLAGAMAGSLISGFAAAQQSQTATPFGFQQTTPGLHNGILQGVAQTTAEQSKRLIDESTTEKPVLVVEAGQAVLVYFEDAVRY